MELEKGRVKAKRKLKALDFSGENAAIALVSSEQGGPANSVPTLLIKAANFSEEFIEKANQIRVTMELPEFLETFYHMWCEEAEVLAAILGYQETEGGGGYNNDCYWTWYREKMMAEGKVDQYGCYPVATDADHKEWIASRLEGIEVLKSLKESDSVAEVLSTLSEDQYLAMLRDQERVEKALSRKEEALANEAARKTAIVAEQKKPKARVVKASDKGHKAEPVPEKTGNDAKAVKAEPKTEVQKMTVKTVEVEKTETMEMVEKAQFDVIQKALDEQKVALEKALETVAKFEKEKKEAIAKARKEALVEAVEKEEEAEKLFKAVGELETEAFDAVLAVVKALAAKTETDPMFKEQGKPVEGEQVQKSALRAKLEAKYKK